MSSSAPILVLISLMITSISALNTLNSHNTLNTLNPIPIKTTNPSAYFYIKTEIGAKSQVINLSLDMSTPLTWAQCAKCTNCFEVSLPNLNSNSSEDVPFKSEFCVPPVAKATHKGHNSSCEYDTGFSSGRLVIDRVSLSSASSALALLVMGCGLSNHLDLSVQGAAGNPIGGMIGLGHGHPTSILNQMVTSNVTQAFSYCLPQSSTPTPTSSTTLIFGDGALLQPGRYKDIQTTPLVSGRDRSSFYLNVTTVKINGGTPIDIYNSEPGFVIDAGAPLTLLSKHVYPAFRQGVINYFMEQYGLTPLPEPKTQGLDLCFNALDGAPEIVLINYPKVELGFHGGATLELRQVFRIFKAEGELCMLITPTIGVGPSILGGLQQVQHRFSFDLNRSRMTYAPHC